MTGLSQFVYFAMGSAAAQFDRRRTLGGLIPYVQRGTSFAYETIIHGHEVQDTGDCGISFLR
jgi:hypothetical protein